MDERDTNKETPKEGFEALLKQNEIAEAQRVADKKIESIEERIKREAPDRAPSIVKSIRTFRGDIEEGVASGKTTLVGIATANAQAEDGVSFGKVLESVRSEKTRRLAIVVISIALVGAGILGIYLAYSAVSKPDIISSLPALLLPTEQTIAPNITTLSSEEFRTLLMRLRDETDQQVGTMLSVVPGNTVSNSDGGSSFEPLTSETFFTKALLNAPAGLVRSFAPQFLFGIHIFDGNQPFLMVKISSYESAFAGMLDWEESIIDSLGPILRKESDLSFGLGAFAIPKFEDAVIKNVDVRALKNSRGKTVILYAFPSRGTLVITTNAETFGEILTRLGSRSVVR